MCRHDSTNEMHSLQKQDGQVVTAGRKTDLLSQPSSFCARTSFKKKPLLANGERYPLVGGTRVRHFDGTNFKPHKLLENAQTPTSRVHALLGCLFASHVQCFNATSPTFSEKPGISFCIAFYLKTFPICFQFLLQLGWKDKRNPRSHGEFG